MPILKDDDTTKLYYTIGEVADLFDVNTSLIRFWEKEFDSIKPKKNKKGNRLFSPEDIEHFKLIHKLVKEEGFTLDGAKKYLKENRKSVKIELKNERLFVSEIESKLKDIKKQLLDLQTHL